MRRGIIVILLLSSVLHFTRLSQEGFANLYYAAGVKSMLMSWHNFFFVSFDPGGFISVDKPPLGFWLQTMSAGVFGFKGWSLLFPQALAGVVSVYLVYLLVKRHFDVAAGLISGLVLALTPIFVAASRNNTIDVLLAMTTLIAALVFLQATERMSWKRLMLAYLFIGIGFNIKSMEAYLVLPAFYVTYLFAPGGAYKRRILHLLGATFILIVSSLPWFVAVDSVPPEQRPYVGSSESNSELELATGYNGLGHFLGHGVRVPGRQGQFRSSAGTPPPDGISQDQNTPSADNLMQSGTPGIGSQPDGGQPAAPVPRNTRQLGMMSGETGAPGLWRLINRQLGGQIGWLLPMAVGGIALAFYQFRRHTLPVGQCIGMMFWSWWLIPLIIFFSIAQGFHRYYLVMMAPAVAALAGIAYTDFAERVSAGGKIRFLLPGILLITTGTQIWIITRYAEWRYWMPALVCAAGLSAVLLAVLWAAQGETGKRRYGVYAAAVGILSMLIAPLAWSVTPVLYGAKNPSFPYAGPDLDPRSAQVNAPGAMPNMSGRMEGVDYARLAAFLMDHRSGEKFIAAVPNARIAAPLILDTGQAVITYGGYMGSEKILKAGDMENLAQAGQVRYILTGSPPGQQSEIDAWATSHGIPIPETEWQSNRQTGAVMPGTTLFRRMPMHLYEYHP